MTKANAVVAKNVANIYKEADTDTEMVTQAIMGQPLIIEKEEGEWLYVQTWDSYHGWIRAIWVSKTVPQPKKIVTVTTLFTDAFKTPDPKSEIHAKLVITTAIEFVAEENGFTKVLLPSGTEAWILSKDAQITESGEQLLNLGPSGPELIRTGKRFLSVPYLWGGTSPFGLDCSGFVQLTYKLNGMRLLRDAGIQATDPRAKPVEKEELVAGDLVFFAGSEDESRITHIGMAVGDGTFIHSAGKGMGVVINDFNDAPYAKNYWGARRMEAINM